jgi:hypothetical protein
LEIDVRLGIYAGVTEQHPDRPVRVVLWIDNKTKGVCDYHTFEPDNALSLADTLISTAIQVQRQRAWAKEQKEATDATDAA